MSLKVKWVVIRVEHYEEHDNKLALNNIAYTISSKKNKHSIWGRINTSWWSPAGYTKYRTSYEVLIPNVDDDKISILKDLGYNIENCFVSRKDRRDHYTKVKKP